ncbi:MAG TPA: AMP-binding protein [Pseudonocardiaceae bacterium]|nr:AMP-binding protein [Pseudonocardiaceae bacterium]
MKLVDLTGDRGSIEAVQADNLARMRAAVLRSETCKAVREYADALDPALLSDAPLMTREQLAEWGSNPQAPNRISTGAVRLALRSSGSSGRVRTLLHERVFNEQVEAIGARGICWDGLSDNPFVINALTPGDLFGGFGFVDATLGRRGAALLPTGSGMADAHIADLIADLGVEAIVATPSYLEHLYTTVPGAVAALRTVFYLGDRMSFTAARDIADAGPAVRSFAYSTTETGPIGFQCGQLAGSDHHVHEDVVIAEVVDEHGRPLPDGDEGALVVTVLTETGAALVRYLVGDRATLLPPNGICDCGSGARLLRICGRDATSANIGGTLVTREMFDVALAPLGVATDARYQVVTAGEAGSVTLLLTGPALAGISPGTALDALHGHQILRRVVSSARFAGLTVETRRPPYTTSRGKVGFFVHIGDGHE